MTIQTTAAAVGDTASRLSFDAQNTAITKEGEAAFVEDSQVSALKIKVTTALAPRSATTTEWRATSADLLAESDAKAMVAACAEAGVPLMVHENFRWRGLCRTVCCARRAMPAGA